MDHRSFFVAKVSLHAFDSSTDMKSPYGLPKFKGVATAKDPAKGGERLRQSGAFIRIVGYGNNAIILRLCLVDRRQQLLVGFPRHQNKCCRDAVFCKAIRFRGRYVRVSLGDAPQPYGAEQPPFFRGNFHINHLNMPDATCRCVGHDHYAQRRISCTWSPSSVFSLNKRVVNRSSLSRFSVSIWRTLL